MDNRPKKPCKYCGSMDHYPYACFKRPVKPKALKRTPIKRIGKVTQKWIDTRKQWIVDNPPPVRGKYWECYLQISAWCPRLIDLPNLTLDHVVPRSHDPSLRYEPSNLKPACAWCNEQKGSRALDRVLPSRLS